MWSPKVNPCRVFCAEAVKMALPLSSHQKPWGITDRMLYKGDVVRLPSMARAPYWIVAGAEVLCQTIGLLTSIYD